MTVIKLEKVKQLILRFFARLSRNNRGTKEQFKYE